MAEVLAAFSALSSFLQLVDFSVKVGGAAKELLDASKNALTDNVELERLLREYGSVAAKCAEAEIEGVALEDQPSHVRLGRETSGEVRELVSQLQALRLDSTSSGAKRVIQGTHRALRSVARRKDIDKRRRRLQELNALLATSLLFNIWTNDRALASEHLFDPKGRSTENVKQVLDLIQKRNLERILHGLRYPEMKARWRAIEPAWANTYGWALQQQDHGFRTWLGSRSGIFWINGKAGSGKSTLMKYICHHTETTNLLDIWKGNRSLCIAHFFFWYAGSPIQKSITGLLMSILHQILEAVPELASVAFHKHCSAALDDDREIELTHQELLFALRDIAQSPDTAWKQCFCFFIDGLDEYNGNHPELINLLKDLGHHPNVKLCVSSRPWNVFMNAFDSQVPTLRLEDLTQPDIRRYVEENLQISLLAVSNPHNASQKEDIDALTKDMVSRAEGVFLWVVLAVKSVTDGIAEGDSVSFLRYRVSLLPSDLGDFFRAILGRVSPVYKHQTYQALKLAWIQTNGEHNADEQKTSVHISADFSRSFVDYWLIRMHPEGLQGADFVYKAGATSSQFGSDSMAMARETSRFLSAACKDLLWFPDAHGKISQQLFTTSHKVEFLHRTVFDFLNTREMQDMLDERVPSLFRRRQVVHLLNLTRLKFNLPGDDIHALLRYTAAKSLNHENKYLNFEYMEMFASVAQRNLPKKSESTSSELSLSVLTVLPAQIVGFDPQPTTRNHNWLVNCRALATLLAFGHNSIALAALKANSPATFGIPEPTVRGSAQHLVWIAALGEERLQRFPSCDIAPDIIRALRDWDAEGSSSVTEYAVSADCGHHTAWAVFLRKWKLMRPPSSTDSKVWESQWRSQWVIAKLLLGFASNNPMLQTFCGCESPADDAGHVHEWIKAADFISDHVPAEWLQDVLWIKFPLGEEDARRVVQSGRASATLQKLNSPWPVKCCDLLTCG